jgi:hypothetical protein
VPLAGAAGPSAVSIAECGADEIQIGKFKVGGASGGNLANPDQPGGALTKRGKLRLTVGAQEGREPGGLNKEADYAVIW